MEQNFPNRSHNFYQIHCLIASNKYKTKTEHPKHLKHLKHLKHPKHPKHPKHLKHLKHQNLNF